MVSSTNLIVGLTGGMGCGKSTAAARFAVRGFQPLSADQVIRDDLLPSPEIAGAIRARFGPAMLAADGSVRRDRVAEKVLNDPAALAWLEELLHPLLLARWRDLFATSRGTAFIVEVPLLFEKGLENWFDFTVCVSTDSASQLRRLEQRGISPEFARQRIAKQLPLARKCGLADFVLLNDGTPEFLCEQVDALADRLLKSQPDRPAGRIHGSPP
ncbi:MAG TPA: dephospho-CoA kinase [Lacunisphaera sp.]|nr:dephospho-CoA kinase [Lacunisphaera sp.]